MEPTRKQLLIALERISEEQPDWRLGQLVDCLAVFARGPFHSATSDVDDDELLAAALRHIENLEKRRQVKEQVRQMATAIRQKAAA